MITPIDFLLMLGAVLAAAALVCLLALVSLIWLAGSGDFQRRRARWFRSDADATSRAG